MKPHFRLSLSFDGHIDVHVAASPGHTAIVRSHQQESLQVLLYGRLYYLETVAERYGLPSGLNELGLVFKLYHQEGPEALQALEGEFALAIADETRKTITLCRDPMGNYPLYWRQQGQAWVISTRLQDLGEPSIAALNPDYIAQYLGYSFAFTELNSEQTIYQSCYRLQPGQGCQFSPEQAPRTLFQQNLITQLSPISDITPSEAGEQFKQILTTSTAVRCQFGKVGAHLSGGMDSSAVVCLVPSSVNLTTLSLVYHLKTLVKETDYIQLMLEQEPRLHPVLVQADELTDFQWFDFPLPDHDEPYAGLFHLAIETVLAQRAGALGLNTVLTGSGAEIVATANQLSLADQLARGHWRTVLTQAKQWAIAENQNLWTVLSSRALKPLLPSWLRYSPKTWLNQGVGSWPNLGSFDIAPWITPSFAKPYQLWHRNRQLIDALRRSPIEQTFDQLALRCLSGVWANWHLNNAQGVHIAQPFLDPRLIRFSLSLPPAIRDVPGQRKPLLQTAMQGLLPPKILQRKYKANFNEPYWKGLNANLENLKALIRRSPFLEPQGTLPPLFTADTLEHCLEKHAVGIGDIGSGSHLCRTLSLMAWWEAQS